MLLTREERAGQQCRFAQSLSRFGEARQLIPSLGRPEPVLEGEFTLRPGLWVEDQDVVELHPNVAGYTVEPEDRGAEEGFAR